MKSYVKWGTLNAYIVLLSFEHYIVRMDSFTKKLKDSVSSYFDKGPLLAVKAEGSPSGGSI